MRTSVPGVVTGLAWTPTGGDLLFIEATRVPGSNKLILTGQLGDVMKESAQAALSLVKGRAAAFGIDAGLFEKSDVHIHVPAGAIPKDGPSAGVAMFLALVSLLTGRTARSDTAMTGEISLRGLVLPIGGVKEKVLAATRAGITTVMLPARNQKDLEDVPDAARKQLRFVWLDQADDAIAAALNPPGEQQQGDGATTRGELIRATSGEVGITTMSGRSAGMTPSIMPLEHFPEKWTPVFRRKCDQLKEAGARFQFNLIETRSKQSNRSGSTRPDGRRPASRVHRPEDRRGRETSLHARFSVAGSSRSRADDRR